MSKAWTQIIQTTGSIAWLRQLARILTSRYLVYMGSEQTVTHSRIAKAFIVVSKVIGVLFLGIVVLVLLLMWSWAAPSDNALGKRFQSHRFELETLARMSEEDADVIKVADTFIRLKNDWSWPRPESEWGITRERWDEYRRLFREVGLIGWEKDDVGNIDLVAHSTGFAPAGLTTKGFVHCNSALTPDKAFLPCVEQRDRGQSDTKANRGSTYRKLDQDWYIFEAWD